MPGAARSFRLRGRLVDPSLNRVSANGDTVQVEPKIMQVLVALASRPGEVVSRDELMASVWRDVFVTDDVLHRAVRELRRIFEDDRDQPHVIETIRKRGYRLVAPVEPLDASGSTSAPLDSAASAQPSRVVSLRLAFAFAAVAAAAAALAWLMLARHGGVSTEARMRFVPLTSEAGNELDPALTADGDRLAYVARGADARAHVFVKEIGGTAVQVTRGDTREMTPVWSPDGTRLAFARLSDRTCNIEIAVVTTGVTRSLGACGSRNETKMSWSPDGRQLAISSGEGTPVSPISIDLLDLETGYRRILTHPAVGEIGDTAPAFSPDGRRVAFVRTITGSIGDVFTAHVDDGSIEQMTFDNADIIGADWEPDGHHLVFSSDRAGGYTLWRVASGEAPVLIAGGGAKLKQPAIARRAGTIAYESWQYDINVVDMPATGTDRPGTLARVSPTTDQWNFHPQIAPDGARLVFQSTRSGQYELWLADRDGLHARPLTTSSVYKSMARWSPDERHLAFVTRGRSQFDLSVLDIDSHAVRVVTGEQSGIVAPAWSADGRAIYFGSRRDGSWQVWKIGLDGTGRVAVTTDGGYAAVESFDGRTLYFTRLDRRGIWRRAVAGGPPELVVDSVAPEDWASWGLSGRGIYFLSRPDDGDPVAMLLEPGRKSARPLGRLEGYAWSGFSVARDADHIFFAHTERRDANILSIAFASPSVSGSGR